MKKLKNYGIEIDKTYDNSKEVDSFRCNCGTNGIMVDYSRCDDGTVHIDVIDTSEDKYLTIVALEKRSDGVAYETNIEYNNSGNPVHVYQNNAGTIYEQWFEWEDEIYILSKKDSLGFEEHYQYEGEGCGAIRRHWDNQGNKYFHCEEGTFRKDAKGYFYNENDEIVVMKSIEK